MLMFRDVDAPQRRRSLRGDAWCCARKADGQQCKHRVATEDAIDR
jgi:hypothetical protein